MFYKVCVIITDGEPQDLEETINNLVISSCKPISFIVVSVQMKIHDKVDHQHLIPTFDQIHQLASEIQYSTKFCCY